MFKLLKIENARMNVPSPAYYEVTADERILSHFKYVTQSNRLDCTTRISGNSLSG